MLKSIIKNEVDNFVNEHEYELFTNQLRELLENKITRAISQNLDINHPLEKMAIEMERHCECKLGPNHTINVDITIPYKEVKFTIIRDSWSGRDDCNVE